MKIGIQFWDGRSSQGIMHNKTPQNGQAISQLHVLQKNKKNCTTSPSILYSFSSALLQLARHRASAIPPFLAMKLHSHEQATTPRHHPRHDHATPPCPYCNWPLNGETLGTRREKAKRTHLTNVKADRRGHAGAHGGGPHGRARWRAA